MSPTNQPTRIPGSYKGNKLVKGARKLRIKTKHYLSDFKIPKKEPKAKVEATDKTQGKRRPTRREKSAQKDTESWLEKTVEEANLAFDSELQTHLIDGLPDRDSLLDRIHFVQKEQLKFRDQVDKGNCFLLLRNGDSNKIWYHSEKQLKKTFGTDNIYFQRLCERTKEGYSYCKCCIRVGVREEAKDRLIAEAIAHPEKFQEPTKPALGNEEQVLYPYIWRELYPYCDSLFEETKPKKGEIPRVQLVHTLDNNGRLREHHVLLLQPEDIEKPSWFGRTLSNIADSYPYPVDYWTPPPTHETLQQGPYYFKYSKPTTVHQPEPTFGDLLEIPYFPHYAHLKPDP